MRGGWMREDPRRRVPVEYFEFDRQDETIQIAVGTYGEYKSPHLFLCNRQGDISRPIARINTNEDAARLKHWLRALIRDAESWNKRKRKPTPPQFLRRHESQRRSSGQSRSDAPETEACEPSYTSSSPLTESASSLSAHPGSDTPLGAP